MKKIFTLFFAVVLVGAAAFAQDGRHRSNNNNSYDNSWQQQYPPVNGYGYSNPYGNTRGRDQYRHRDEDYYGRTGWYSRDRDHYRAMRRNHRWNDSRYYDNYRRHRTGVSFQITIGGHRQGY